MLASAVKFLNWKPPGGGDNPSHNPKSHPNPGPWPEDNHNKKVGVAKAKSKKRKFKNKSNKKFIPVALSMPQSQGSKKV